MKGIFSTAIIVAFAVTAQARNYTPSVIYGDDGRTDVFQMDRSDLRELADSTVALMKNDRLTSAEGNRVNIASKNYGASYDLCKDEPYYNQPSAAFCSGFLVGEDMIATAGHCVKEETCADTSFVFGFRMTSSTEAVSQVSGEEVYHCTSIVGRELTGNQDYALIKLDRPVKGHRILPLAKNPVQKGDGVFVIGHPAGLPTKVTLGAEVRRQEEGFFVTNLDTYGGNSGSGVFDAKTLDVVGILVRGEQDFEYDSAAQCTRSKVCTSNSCRGEDVTNISYISKAMGQ